RNPHNLGAAANYNLTFEYSSGIYFKWSAHDDLCAPTFLEKCVNELDRSPDVVLACPEILYINSDGKVIGESPYNSVLETKSARSEIRFCSLMLSGCMNFQCFGLMRSDALRKTPLLGGYDAADQVLLAQLALLGRFSEIPEKLFYYRLHPKQSINLGHDPVAYSAWFDPANQGRIIFPHWRYFFEYWKSILFADMSLKGRLYCHLQLARWARWSAKRLRSDFKPALRQFRKLYLSGETATQQADLNAIVE
ncbi:MAG TPA: glycosyltransferase, partial [Blastocatellia bacterium]|nr:glycosyltransferase [Blastocatellia bacterium]